MAEYVCSLPSFTDCSHILSNVKLPFYEIGNFMLKSFAVVGPQNSLFCLKLKVGFVADGRFGQKLFRDCPVETNLC